MAPHMLPRRWSSPSGIGRWQTAHGSLTLHLPQSGFRAVGHADSHAMLGEGGSRVVVSAVHAVIAVACAAPQAHGYVLVIFTPGVPVVAFHADPVGRVSMPQFRDQVGQNRPLGGRG